MSEANGDTGFGSDPTDNRKLLEWRSLYPPEANVHIRVEAIYLGLLLAATPVLMMFLLCKAPHALWKVLGLGAGEAFTTYGLAWMAGTLGGTLYAIKWLYHVVARQLWNYDRRLWRVFTPHISGGFAFAILTLISSGILKIFDSQAVHSRSVVVSIAFLVGYFSDSAVAKLTEIAETLFGKGKSKEAKSGDPAQIAGKAS